MDALNNEHLENQCEVNDNVGQDVSGNENTEPSSDWKSQAKYFQPEKDKLYSENQTQNEGTSNDWESQAKYFQSEKDKLHAENQKLKDYEQVGKLLESRPDIVNAISSMVQGGQPEAAERESVASRQRTEVEKFKGKLKEHELESKTANKSQVDKLTNAVKLEVEKSRLRGETQNDRQKLQAKGGK